MIEKDDKDAQIEYLKNRLMTLRSRLEELTHHSYFGYHSNDFNYSYVGMIDFIDKSIIEVTY